MDVSRVPVDVLVADGHKWLLGAEACALFYVAENARERVPPVAAGWWNVKSESGFLDYELDFFLGARRYEAGSLPSAQIEGLAAAIDLLEEMGGARIRERILETVGALAEGLAARGWTIASPEPYESGILAAVPPDGDVNRAAKDFERRGVIIAPREGAVRFSPHAYNDFVEVERIVEAAREIARPGGTSAIR